MHFTFGDITGPACPKCGCQDGHDVKSFTFAGVERTRRECRSCGRQFIARAEAQPPPIRTDQPAAIIPPTIPTPRPRRLRDRLRELLRTMTTPDMP